MLEMRHCGIDAWGANEIPFGVRAIQSGIEVEGIWISRPYTPDFSRIASSTTLIGEPSDCGKAKGVWPEKTSRLKRPRYASGSSTIDQTLSEDPLLPHHSPVLVALNYPPSSSDDAPDSPDQHPFRPEPQVSSYVPTGLHKRRQPTEDAEPQPPNPFIMSSLAVESTVDGVHLPTGESLPCGNAEVFVHRDTRRTNQGFEVPPADILGPRQELDPLRSDVPEEGIRDRQPKRRNKLRKNPPPNHGL